MFGPSGPAVVQNLSCWTLHQRLWHRKPVTWDHIHRGLQNGSRSQSLITLWRCWSNGAARKVDQWAILQHSSWSKVCRHRTTSKNNEPQRFDPLRFFYEKITRSPIPQILIKDLQYQFIHWPSCSCSEFQQLLFKGRRQVDIKLLWQFAGVNSIVIVIIRQVHNSFWCISAASDWQVISTFSLKILLHCILD